MPQSCMRLSWPAIERANSSSLICSLARTGLAEIGDLLAAVGLQAAPARW